MAKKTLKQSRVTWVHVVGPKNTIQMHISQRTDGPFAKDIVGSKGYYYCSVEKYDKLLGDFKHIFNSTTVHHSYEEALKQAQKNMSARKYK